MNIVGSFTGRWTMLSNFHASPIRYTFDDMTYPTVENFFQAMKTQDVGQRRRFVDCTPSRAKYLGRSVQLRTDWEQIKLQVMTYAVELKFSPGSDFAAVLLSSGTSYLEEGNTWGDYFWGAVNGEGENWLGLILMRRREQLRRLTSTRTD